MMEIFGHIPWWLWLLVSVIPYSIKRQQRPDMQSLTLSALFWQFCIKYQKGYGSWSFSIPWIEQMQRARHLRTVFIKAGTTLAQEWVKKVISFWR
jgi:hypothetical protein